MNELAETYPERLITGCVPGDGDTTLKKQSDGTLLGALVAGNEYEAVGLIKSGANVNTSPNTTSPLHVSVGCISSTVAAILIRYGANLNAINNVGETALHLAARFGHFNAVRLLLRHGAAASVPAMGRSSSKMPKTEYNQRWTPLHEACEQGSVEITKELLIYGSRVDARTATGSLPLDIATENNHRHVISVFQEFRDSEAETNQQRLMFDPRSATESLIPHLQGLIGQGGGTPKLCLTCAQLKQTSEDEIARSSCHCIWYDSVSQVRRSAASGCPLCVLLMDCLSNHSLEGKENTGVYVRSGTTWYSPKPGGPVGIIMGFMGDDARGEDIRHSIQITLDPEGKEAPDWVELMRLSPVTDDAMITTLSHDCSRDTSTGSIAAVEIAATWLSTCVRNHAICSSNLKPAMLPTRVLHVGSDTQMPFLYESCSNNAHYITLSYTWGGQVPLTTTLGTLAERKKGIPFEDLPQTFKDAVLFCRALGIQYIWIDALCIIQDSNEDWTCEAGKMAQFFHNSLLTLAAADSASALDGLFRTRLRGRSRPYLLEPRIPFRSRSELGSGRLSLVGGPRTNGSLVKPASVLYTRGWVLQEQVLATRTLAFSKGELFWDCMCLRASERHPMGIPVVPDMRDRDIQFFKEYVYANTDLSSNSRRIRFHVSYRTIVEMYTERKLTNIKDKLYAFQGIADAMNDNLGIKVLSGQIATDPTCLAWKVKGDFEDLPMAKAAWRAPSWSWASIDAAVEFSWYSEFTLGIPRALVEFVDFAHSVTNRVHSASQPLKVRGRIIPASLITTKGNEMVLQCGENQDKSIDVKWYPDTKTQIKGQIWALHVIINGDCGAGICLISGGESSVFSRIGVYSFAVYNKDKMRMFTKQDGHERVLTLI